MKAITKYHKLIINYLWEIVGIDILTGLPVPRFAVWLVKFLVGVTIVYALLALFFIIGAVK